MEDRYSSAFDEVRASDQFKADMVRRMRALNTIEPQEQPRRSVSVPKRLKKRTLTILIAAVILLIGGFGAFVRSFWEGKAVRPKVTCFGVRDVFIQHGDHDHLLADAGLKPEQVALAIRESLQAGASCSACDPLPTAGGGRIIKKQNSQPTGKTDVNL